MGEATRKGRRKLIQESERETLEARGARGGGGRGGEEKKSTAALQGDESEEKEVRMRRRKMRSKERGEWAGEKEREWKCLRGRNKELV